LPTVVVTPTRLPTPESEVGSSITVITEEDIQRKQERTLPDALRDVPGLNVVQTGGPGGQTSVFIRGANSNQTKVFIDGIDATDPASGTFNFEHVLTWDIERVEVVRGPQSGLYGGDAIGGVINIITKKGSGPAQFAGSLEGGTFGTLNQNFRVGGATERFNYYFDFAHWQSNDTPVTPADLVPAGRSVQNDSYDNKTYSARFGAVLTDNFDLDVEEGEAIGIIGPNGAGKSTLFNLITGHLVPDGGRVLLDGDDITGAPPYRICRLGIGRSFQRTNIFPRLSVFENVQAAFLAHRGRGRNFWSHSENFYREETAALLASIGLGAQGQVVAGTLSYGNQKQLELGLALASDPMVLLLDEPTAGMSAGETHETMRLLERIAGERGLTLLFTEHDMEVVFSIAEKIAVLHQGRLLAEGTPNEVRGDPEVRRVYLGEH